MKILAADGISPEGIGLLTDYEVDVRDKISHEELLDVIGDYDALMVRSASKVTADVLERAGKLKIIGRDGAYGRDDARHGAQHPDGRRDHARGAVEPQGIRRR